MRRIAGFAVSLVLSALGAHAQQSSSLADLKTKAEASGFKSTSNYEDVVTFMKTVASASSDDGLVAWNFLDDQLKDAKTYPILRQK